MSIVKSSDVANTTAIDTVAKEVIQGKWGNGAERKQRLESAGYNYAEVQARVNALMGSGASANLDIVARAVILGQYGNGVERKQRLEAAGYNYAQVQARVNALMSGSTATVNNSLDGIAREVIQGKWGNGAERKQRLESAGYDYNAVQARVNQLCR